MSAAVSTLRNGWEDETASDDTLSLAALRAMAGRAVEWARAAGGRVRCEPGLVLADAGSPCPFLNVAAAPGPVDADAVVAFMTAGGERPFVLVSPHPTPDLRGARLELMGHPPLMIRPAGGTAPAPAPGITVEEVVDAAGLATWDGVLAAGFPTPASPAPLALLGGPTRFWLARREGEPVATALSYSGHGVVNVEAVATLAAHRGHGAGTAVTWAATVAEPALPAVLLSSDDGIGINPMVSCRSPAGRWFRA